MSSYKWNLGSGHKTIFEYYKDSINLKNYFKWCFVRNPWERIASAYEDCPEIFQVAPTFNKFIETIHSNRNKIPKNHISYSNFYNIGFPNHLYRIHFMPMNLLIKVNGELCVDFIGKYENLKEDWGKIQREINIKPQELILSNARKQKINFGRKTSYYKDLFNQYLIDLVGEIYEEDVKLFNYSFS